MRTTAKLGLTALLAALTLASALSTASARSLSISNQNIRVTWTSLEFVSSISTIRCQVTLEGSFHSRTIAKVARSLIGYITRAIVNEPACTNGQGRPLTETLPWHITYEGFAGTLPNISALFLLLRGVRFRLTVPGLCTGDYGAAEDNITGRAAVVNRRVTTLEGVTGRNIARRISSTAFCPSQGSFVSAGNVMLLGTTNQIEVLLI